MKGDFSRLPFQADIETKHYGAVLDQQGRVKTDYDKAVEVAIESHLRQHALRDIIGRSGAPADNPGFRLSRTPQRDLIIGAGDYYVDGILCTNDRDVSFTEQPDLPGQELPRGRRALSGLSPSVRTSYHRNRGSRHSRGCAWRAGYHDAHAHGLRGQTVPGGTGRTLSKLAAGMGGSDLARQRPAVCARSPL